MKQSIANDNSNAEFPGLNNTFTGIKHLEQQL